MKCESPHAPRRSIDTLDPVIPRLSASARNVLVVSSTFEDACSHCLAGPLQTSPLFPVKRQSRDQRALVTLSSVTQSFLFFFSRPLLKLFLPRGQSIQSQFAESSNPINLRSAGSLISVPSLSLQPDRVLRFYLRRQSMPLAFAAHLHWWQHQFCDGGRIE